jgi:NADH-quinone oxidoreductase subunit K
MIATLPIGHLIAISIALFLIGLVGILTRRNLIFILVSVEIMLNGIALLFVGAGARWSQADGQIMVLFLMVMAAIEVGIGLALFMRVYQRNPSLDPDALQELKG